MKGVNTMNRYILALSLFYCFLFTLEIQADPAADIVLYSQSQVDDFPNAYPNYAELVGELKIYGDTAPPEDRITNLLALSQITSVSEGLKIYYCIKPTNLQ